MSTIWIRRFRRSTQLLSLLLLTLMPWLDIFRLDLAGGYFVIAGKSFLISQLFLLILAFGIALTILALFARTMGRLFCGWLCPQTTWSELGGKIVERISKYKKIKNPSSKKTKLLINIITRLLIAVPLMWLFYTVLVSYFISPEKIVAWYTHEGLPMWYVALGAKFSVLAFIDLVVIRHSYCQSLCPYGLMQKVVQKNKVFKVTFNPDACIDCNLCDQACPMDLYPRSITPKDSCISCQQCVVACGTRAEKFQEKKMDYGTENCLSMSFKPYEPTLREKFDKVSFGFLSLAVALATIFTVVIVLDNGLDVKITPITATQAFAQEGEEQVVEDDVYYREYQLKIANTTSEEKEFSFEIRSEVEGLSFVTVPEKVTVSPTSEWEEEIEIGLFTNEVNHGRFIIWVDVYSQGEVVESIKSVFYYQPRS
ncbi:4Fe-4S binding protein [Anaerobacillus sp. MEB173]|uniref:4Fe-4S binding protein n=1 Tax=Anaerobacillus sp. MEB173 TaxID=3383345 RepID=UPI003F8F3F69